MSTAATGTQGSPPAKSGDDLNWLMRSLVVIEKAGNKLPHPFWLFLSLAVVVMILSWILANAGTSAVNPATGETVTAVNLLSQENLYGQILFFHSLTVLRIKNPSNPPGLERVCAFSSPRVRARWRPTPRR